MKIENNLLSVRGTAKSMMAEFKIDWVYTVDLLNRLAHDGLESPPDKVFEAVKIGLVIESDKDGRKAISPCTDLELKVLLEAGNDPEPIPEKEVVKEEPKQFELDGPGEYYQLTIEQAGIGIVRSSFTPGEWVSKSLAGVLHFPNYWMIFEDEPARRLMEKDGQQYAISIPRLRFVKTERGAFVDTKKIILNVPLLREDPLVKNLMTVKTAVVEMRGA